MAEKRMISKVISISKKFNIRLNDHFSRLLYVLLIPHSDDFGRLTGDPFKIKALILPMMDDAKWEDVESSLSKLHQSELIIWYEVDGEKYIQINNFDEHQSGLHKRTRSKIPEPPEVSRNFPEFPFELNRTELNRTEEKGREENEQEQHLKPRSGMIGNNPFSLYEKQGFGKIDETTAIFVGEAIDTYGEDWTRRAMTEAVKHNKKVWSYVEGILKRWKSTGHAEPWTLEKELPKQQQQNRGYGYRPTSPKMDVVKDTGQTREITPEERERMLARAKRMQEESKQGGDNGQGRIA